MRQHRTLFFMTFSLHCSGLFSQSRADASRWQVCFRATHCSNTTLLAVHPKEHQCISISGSVTRQHFKPHHSATVFFFPPNSASTREFILLCYFEIRATYVNYGACWDFQRIFRAVTRAQVIRNDQLKLSPSLLSMWFFPPKKSGSRVPRGSSPVSLIGFHQLKHFLKC